MYDDDDCRDVHDNIITHYRHCALAVLLVWLAFVLSDVVQWFVDLVVVIQFCQILFESFLPSVYLFSCLQSSS